MKYINTVSHHKLLQVKKTADLGTYVTIIRSHFNTVNTSFQSLNLCCKSVILCYKEQLLSLAVDNGVKQHRSTVLWMDEYLNGHL